MSEPVRRRWPRVALILMLVIVLAFIGWRVTLRVLISRELDSVRAKGEPVTFSDLNEWYPDVPATENAANLYVQAFDLITRRDRGKPVIPIVEAPIPSGDLSGETEGVFQTYLVGNEKIFQLLKKGGGLKRCRYRLPDEITKPAPYLPKVGQATRLLAFQAWWCARQGDSSRSAGAIVDALRLANSLRDAPLSSFQLARNGSLDTSITTLLRILQERPFQEADYASIQEVLADSDRVIDCARTLAGDRSAIHEYFLHYARMPRMEFRLILAGEGAELMESPSLFGLYKSSGLYDRDQLHYLRVAAKLIDGCGSPWAERRDQYEKLFWEIGSKRPALILTARSLSFSEIYARKAVATATQVRLARIAISVERFRAEHGQLPEALQDCTNAHNSQVPLDPFCDQPFRYKRLKAGYLIYSLGPDGGDDGGDEKRDITFKVERE